MHFGLFFFGWKGYMQICNLHRDFLKFSVKVHRYFRFTLGLLFQGTALPLEALKMVNFIFHDSSDHSSVMTPNPLSSHDFAPKSYPGIFSSKEIQPSFAHAPTSRIMFHKLKGTGDGKKKSRTTLDVHKDLVINGIFTISTGEPDFCPSTVLFRESARFKRILIPPIPGSADKRTRIKLDQRKHDHVDGRPGSSNKSCCQPARR